MTGPGVADDADPAAAPAATAEAAGRGSGRALRPWVLAASLVLAAGIGAAVAVVVKAAWPRSEGAEVPSLLSATLTGLGIALAATVVACGLVAIGFARAHPDRRSRALSNLGSPR